MGGDGTADWLVCDDDDEQTLYIKRLLTPALPHGGYGRKGGNGRVRCLPFCYWTAGTIVHSGFSKKRAMKRVFTAELS